MACKSKAYLSLGNCMSDLLPLRLQLCPSAEKAQLSTQLQRHDKLYIS